MTALGKGAPTWRATNGNRDSSKYQVLRIKGGEKREKKVCGAGIALSVKSVLYLYSVLRTTRSGWWKAPVGYRNTE